jgi:tRNA(fMet)-specific endonuclease VapC
MIILDTDHLTAIKRERAGSARLKARLAAVPDVVTTIVNAEEMMRGWLAEINRAKLVQEQVRFYGELRDLLGFFRDVPVLPFDTLAATRFQALQKLRLRSIGTQDLKIAAIALRYVALLLSANLQHFRLVPGLRVEDWLYEAAAQGGDS